MFQVRSKIARGACDQPKAGCMGPVVSYNLIPIGQSHSIGSCHWMILERAELQLIAGCQQTLGLISHRAA